MDVTEMFASQSERLAILEAMRDDIRDSISKTEWRVKTLRSRKKSLGILRKMASSPCAMIPHDTMCIQRLLEKLKEIRSDSRWDEILIEKYQNIKGIRISLMFLMKFIVNY